MLPQASAWQGRRADGPRQAHPRSAARAAIWLFRYSPGGIKRGGVGEGGVWGRLGGCWRRRRQLPCTPAHPAAAQQGQHSHPSLTAAGEIQVVFIPKARLHLCRIQLVDAAVVAVAGVAAGGEGAAGFERRVQRRWQLPQAAQALQAPAWLLSWLTWPQTSSWRRPRRPAGWGGAPGARRRPAGGGGGGSGGCPHAAARGGATRQQRAIRCRRVPGGKSYRTAAGRGAAAAAPTNPGPRAHWARRRHVPGADVPQQHGVAIKAGRLRSS